MEMIIGLGASPWPNFKRYRMERPTAGITPATVIPGIEFVPFRPVLGWLKKFVPIGDDFARGTEASSLLVPMRGESVAFGALIC